jgi:hypothetical protein
MSNKIDPYMVMVGQCNATDAAEMKEKTPQAAISEI